MKRYTLPHIKPIEIGLMLDTKTQDEIKLSFEQFNNFNSNELNDFGIHQYNIHSIDYTINVIADIDQEKIINKIYALYNSDKEFSKVFNLLIETNFYGSNTTTNIHTWINEILPSFRNEKETEHINNVEVAKLLLKSIFHYKNFNLY